MATKKTVTTSGTKKTVKAPFKMENFIDKYNHLMAESKLNELWPVVHGAASWTITLPKVIIASKAEKVILFKVDGTKELTLTASANGKKDKFDPYTGYSVAILKHISALKSTRYDRKGYSTITGATYEEFAKAYMEMLGITRDVFDKWCNPDKNGNIVLEVEVTNGTAALAEKTAPKEAKKPMNRCDEHPSAKAASKGIYIDPSLAASSFHNELIGILLDHLVRSI